MSNTIDEWVVIVSHMGLRDPKAATILFYPSKAAAEESILMTREHQQTEDTRVVLRFDELPDWVQHKAAAAAILDLGDTKVKHVKDLGGKTFGSVWVEYSPDAAGRAFEKMIKEKACEYRNRSAENL